MKQTFEEYLQERFTSQFTGTKDQVESAEENWFERLDVSELIEYCQDYAKKEYDRGRIEAREYFISLLK